ncbi:tetraspanin-18 [Biomphalaria glabrata]|nr:tetraspanin-18 [Biomphalaria glabrata]
MGKSVEVPTSTNKSTQAPQSRFNMLEPINILLITMIISMFWGIFMVISGCIIRFFSFTLLNGLIESSKEISTEKKFAKNSAGQDVTPLMTEAKTMPDIGDWLFVLGSVVISNGSLTIIYSLLCFIAAFKDLKIILAGDIVLIFVTIALLVYIVQIIYNPFFGFHEIAKNQLTSKIQSSYTIESGNNTFTAMMNSIMVLKQCCGIRGAGDFKNLTFIDNTYSYPEKYQFMLPTACCKSSVFQGDSERKIFRQLLSCAQKGLDDAKNVNLKGCYDEVFRHIQARHRGWLSTAFILMILISAGQVGLTILSMLTTGPPPQKIIFASVPTVDKRDAAIEVSMSPLYAPTPRAPNPVYGDLVAKVTLVPRFLMYRIYTSRTNFETKIESLLVSRVDGLRLRMLYSSLFQSLSASMVVTFVCGATFFTIGLLMTFCQKLIMEDFLDPVVKKANLTQLLINSYESIVPTKDDLPTSVYLGSWTTTLPYGVLIVGVAMLAFSVFGSFAARFMSSLPLTIVSPSVVLVVFSKG